MMRFLIHSFKFICQLLFIFMWTDSISLSQGSRDYFITLCYHDVVEEVKEIDVDSILVHKLMGHFQWLKQNGYTPVSIQDIIDAHDGKKCLPDKAVLLTFDDGYKSFYDKVFPLLKVFNYPAVLGVCGIWIDTKGKKGFYKSNNKLEMPEFMTWEQIREVHKSGLVEIANHSYDLHHGVKANPQGNTQASAITLQYHTDTGEYETKESLRKRVHKDLKKNSDRIAQHIGKRPRVMVWPYGRHSQMVQEIAEEVGMPINFVLSNKQKNKVYNIGRISRSYYAEDEDISELIDSLEQWERKEIQPIRSIRVDLDYLYDPDPKQFEKNLSSLVSRIHEYQISTVFLQAYVDDKAKGYASQVYFPNRHLPMKADIMNRVTWQLHSRAGVNVFAWIPLIGFDLGREDLLVKSIEKGGDGTPRVDPQKYKRLSCFNKEAQQKIKEIFEDLTLHVPVDGIAFHDDGFLTDFEDASPAGIQAQVAAGFPGSIEEIKKDPARFKEWSHWKTKELTNFSKELISVVKYYRSDAQVTRSLYALPVLNPDSEEWFAQSLDNFIRDDSGYDFAALMAMPYMEKADDPEGWFQKLIDKVKEHPQGLKKVLFELQAVDWNKNNEPIDPAILLKQMRQLQQQGALNYGYYPDDFIKNIPNMAVVKEGLSKSRALFVK